jgi:hypothetical protein
VKQCLSFVIQEPPLRGKAKAMIFRFCDTNPGFDSVIVTPMDDQRKWHFTFIESRYSNEKSGRTEPLAEIQRKHGLVMRDAVSCLATALSRDRTDNVDFEWHFVYALYRKHEEVNPMDLPHNTILLNRDALNQFYGPSLSGLGML